jgi:molybdenum cofactor cytidylyltransferase
MAATSKPAVDPGATSRHAPPPVVGLLLAAGRGRRFDPHGRADKLLQRVPGADTREPPVNAREPSLDAREPSRDVREPSARALETPQSAAGDVVAARACDALMAACATVIAVVRPGAGALGERLTARGATVVTCESADLGMGHSLAAAAAAAVQRFAPAAVAILPADMPWLAPGTAAALVAAWRAAARAGRGASAIVAPRCGGRRGHPVIVGAAHFGALLALRGDRGARDILEAHPVDWVDVDDPGILRDVDTPEDLRRP